MHKDPVPWLAQFLLQGTYWILADFAEIVSSYEKCYELPVILEIYFLHREGDETEVFK